MSIKIDLWKLVKHLLKYCWIIILCAAIGFAGMAGYSAATSRDSYTASATLYVYNNNPNLVNYAYTNVSDLSAAVQLIDTYMVVIRSNKVMDAVVDRLISKYPDITAQYIAGTLSMGSMSQTGVMKISCTTGDPQMSADICNGVVDFAPPEIIRVVGAGSIEVIDYADVPLGPNGHNTFRNAMLGGMAGAVLAAGLLVLVFLLNRKVRDAEELNAQYTLPVLSELPRRSMNIKLESDLLVNEKTPMYVLEAYNKLRMNLNFALMDKRKIIVVSSAVPGEGKSTIAANLAITYARAGKKVLMIDGDMRRGNQIHIFARQAMPGRMGLSNLIIRECTAREAIANDVYTNLDLMLAGSIPPNPAELLGSDAMAKLLKQLETEHGYDLIVIDTPPINVVSDPLVLSGEGVGMLYVVRQNYSDHREIRKALTAAEFSGIDMLGMVIYGERVGLADRGKSKYYRKYYGTGRSVYHSTHETDVSSKWELRPNSGHSQNNDKNDRKVRKEEH